MPIEEKMTLNERRKYLKLMKPRYELAGRAEQTYLLTVILPRFSGDLKEGI